MGVYVVQLDTPGFKPQAGYIWRAFHPLVGPVIFGGIPAHLAHHVPKTVRRASILTLYARTQTHTPTHARARAHTHI